jgi:hypothetical protein
MSRAFGKTQRHILGVLEQHPALWLVDLLPPGYTDAEYQVTVRPPPIGGADRDVTA